MSINEYRRSWYQKNIDAERKRLRSSNKRRQAELVLWFENYKSGLSCKCGEADAACLDFHHSNPKEKEFEISNGVRSGYSKNRILEEIAKCDILCANCHRKLHWRQRKQSVAIVEDLPQ
jgi:hypothetical protein